MSVKKDLRQLKAWRVPQLANVELTRASNITHDYPSHFHEDYSIVLILRGTEITNYRGVNYISNAGSLLIFDAEEVHSAKSLGAEYRIIKIGAETWNQIAFKVFSRRTKRPYSSKLLLDDPFMFWLILRLHLKLEHGLPAFEAECEFTSAIGQLILRLRGNDRMAHRAGKAADSVTYVRDYLKSHYDQTVPLAQLISLTDLSPSYLLRAFRKYVGLPPHEYQTQVRVTRARRLLREGYPISEVAFETGFCDQSHFSRNFKRIVGMPPGQYSAMVKGKIVQDAAE